MNGIIRKDLPILALAVVPILVLDAGYFLATGILDRSRILLLGYGILVSTICGILTVEQVEMKNRGYRFLAVLPLDNRQIVAAKFSLAAGAVFMGEIVSFLILHHLPVKGISLPLADAYVFGCGAVALLLSAGGYLGVFSLGMRRMSKFFILGVAMVFVSIILIDNLRITAHLAHLSVSRGGFGELPIWGWPVATLLVLGAYVGLMQLAVTIRSRGDE